MSVNEGQPQYQHLREIYAENRREFAFWIGAGLSIPAALPTWAQLQEQLVAECFQSLKTQDDDEARAKEQELHKFTKENSPWKIFDKVKKILGEPTYKSSIRQIFSRADAIEPPDLYKDIWSLQGVRSVLTLNIDNFSARAHRKIRPLEDIASFSGRNAGDYGHILKNKKPFIANLHGLHESVSSWVFTQGDLDRLLRDKSYESFIQAVFASLTVVFVGISADDVAAGGFLQKLTAQRFDLGQHFWITGRRDSATEGWASSAGLQVIRYEPDLTASPSVSHTLPIQKIINGLKTFISRDKATTPIVSPVEVVETLPSVKELRLRDDDDLRTLLAGHAKYLIGGENGKTSSEAYKTFLKVYSPCIYQAWHITQDEPYNKFHGYVVSEKISAGSFSNVWKIYNDEGEAKVLKIIQHGNLENGSQLDSFRRGAQSLIYLSDAQVPGTARFLSAFEIPTAVIMDFIEGDNLSRIVQSRNCDFWTDGVDIILSVACHLEFSHNLPQAVLHRDVRPSNIMVPYYYWKIPQAEEAGIKRDEVYLLNYDMSWHTHARGSTITGSIEESGFYAPEQIDNQEGEQARNTKVDSYGLGMTIFYTYTRQIPPPGGSRSVEWLAMLTDKFRRNPLIPWISAPERLKRLVDKSTQIVSQDRPVITQIVAELSALQRAVTSDTTDLPPDMWAEELFARCFQTGYAVERNIFSNSLLAGRTLRLRGDLQNNSVVLDFRRSAIESTQRTGLSKLWATKHKVARDILTAGGWTVAPESTSSNREIIMQASVNVSKFNTEFIKISDSLGRGIHEISLE